MPISKLDTNTALVVIDLQKAIVSLPTVHPIGEIIGRAAELARAFREKRLPVVLVNVVAPPAARTETPRMATSFPPDWIEIVPEMDQQPGDILVSKKSWGAFLTTTLDDILRKQGVTQIVLAGVATSAGVESTARSAYDLGYNVALAIDAMTDRDADSHRHCVEKIFPRLGETDSTAKIIDLLHEKKG